MRVTDGSGRAITSPMGRWVPGTGTVRVDAAEVADAGPLSGSLMPEGLAQALTPVEFRDLVAYLESLR